MLRTEGIGYRIGKKVILDNVGAGFQPGELNMVLGPNGSGKSSFLKIFSGEIQGYEGTIFYDEKPIRSIKTDDLAKCRAVMSQQPELSFPLTVDEVVMMGRYPHFNFNPSKKDEKICGEVMERMNLVAFSDRNYLTLSGGEKQRVQFARVLAQIWEQPKKGYRYLFLDEPLASLDVKYQQEFLQVTREFTNADTVVAVIIHDINLASQFADNLLFLLEGQLVAQGKPNDILTSALIKQVFGVNTQVITNPVSGSPLVVYE